jgi:uncharacterized SAM-binding protein YcdF (DUF218 family)
MGLAPRWISSPLPCQLRLALRARRFSHTLALAAVLLLGPPAAWGGALGGWLAIEDPVERCPAIVVLNGDQPARVDEAARLHHAGVGREIWLTSDPRSGDASIADAGTRSNAARLLAHGGIAPAAIHMVPGAATGTRAELEAVASELRRRTLFCAVLVTSPLHGRRVKLTWQRIVGASPRAVVRHAPGAGHAGWWAEAKELGGTVLAWIGFPW